MRCLLFCFVFCSVCFNRPVIPRRPRGALVLPQSPLFSLMQTKHSHLSLFDWAAWYESRNNFGFYIDDEQGFTSLRPDFGTTTVLQQRWRFEHIFTVNSGFKDSKDVWENKDTAAPFLYCEHIKLLIIIFILKLFVLLVGLFKTSSCSRFSFPSPQEFSQQHLFSCKSTLSSSFFFFLNPEQLWSGLMIWTVHFTYNSLHMSSRESPFQMHIQKTAVLAGCFLFMNW